MPAPKNNTQGFTSNPENRNSKGIRGPRVKKSELRKLLTKLSKLEDPALAIIEKSIQGEDIPKDQLSSAKWVVERVVSTTSAAINEEQRRNTIKKSLEENTEDTPEEDNSVGATEPPKRFSLTMIHNEKKD